MAAVTSSKDKNFLGAVAFDLGMDAVGADFMSSAGAVQIPSAFLARLEKEMSRPSKPAMLNDIREAWKVCRNASMAF
jgi:hypothetical protein